MTSDTTLMERDGFRAGTWWAASRAEPDQLERLVVFRRRLDRSRQMSWKGFFDRGGCCSYTAAELVAFEILGTDQGVDRLQASAFWETTLGADAVLAGQQGFVRAFAEGATEQR